MEVDQEGDENHEEGNKMEEVDNEEVDQEGVDDHPEEEKTEVVKEGEKDEVMQDESEVPSD